MGSSRVTGVRPDSLWQQARVPVFWLNADLKLIAVNRAWEELTGHPADDVSGLVCHGHGPTQAGGIAGLAGSFSPPPEALAGQPVSNPTLIVHASGERLWRRLEYWPFEDDRGQWLGLLGLVRDLADRPRAPGSEALRLRNELLVVRDRLQGRYGFDDLVGRGPAHHRLLDQVSAAAATAVPVLIVGEAGTGKRLVARTIHSRGRHRDEPIIPIDCAVLSPDMLERELFGGRGEGPWPGLALPEGSTLLIGDVLDLTRDLQGRLAESLGERVRLIATTCGDPEVALRSERLRPDLYYALTTLVIRLVPLRDRLDELPLLALHLLERANMRGGRHRSGFSPDALDELLAYDWPGNLDELSRVVVEAQAQGQVDTIGVDDLPRAIRGHLGSAYTPPPLPPAITPLDELLAQVERRLIEQALQRARRNKSRAAELLGISRPRLYRRIKDLNLPDEPETADEGPVSGDPEP